MALPHKYRAFVAGFGTGKTYIGCASQCAHFWEHPKVNQGYFAPTYPHVRDIYYPTIEEVAHNLGLRVKIRQGNHEVDFYSGRWYRGTTICRSMDSPENIVGFKIGRALTDEIDIMKPEKAMHAWRKIIARLRWQGDEIKNGVDVTTTPEGFGFVYRQFVKAVRDNPETAAYYGLVQASTYENAANLPVDYIPSLLSSYPPQLIEAYISGQFVNLVSGTVYHAYDRSLNGCDDRLNSDAEPLFVGMDFNVGKMAAVVHVKRNGAPRAVDEITGGYDTPDMIRQIKERYWKYEDGEYKKSREISVYPDSSGGSRRSVNASETDIALLRDAGFGVFAPAANPPVKDRINAMNGMLCNASGGRRYLINTEMCPVYSECLEQQAWNAQGEPDKSHDLDHLPDAGGYFISHDYPIIKPAMTIKLRAY